MPLCNETSSLLPSEVESTFPPLDSGLALRLALFGTRHISKWDVSGGLNSARPLMLLRPEIAITKKAKTSLDSWKMRDPKKRDPSHLSHLASSAEAADL